MIKVLIGNFGSGKTELAINLAIKEKGTLIDLDNVNPYFRSRRAKGKLENKGVKVIVPPPHLASSDLPVIIPEVLGELQKKDSNIIIDVGGDNVGSVVLGRFSSVLQQKEAQILLVLNSYRPFTGEFKSLEKMIKSIEEAARLKVTGIISNPNLGRDTTLVDVLNGHRKIEELAAQLNIPIKFLSCRKDLLPQIGQHVDIPIVGIDIYMLTPWEEMN